MKEYIETNDEKRNKYFFELIGQENVSSKVKFKKASYLISLGADVNARRNGHSLASWAKEKGEEEIYQLLIAKGGKEWVLEGDEKKKLIKKFVDGADDFSNIEEGYKLGIDINVCNESGWTALIKAAYWDNIEGVSFLIDKGGDVNHKTEKGRTALMEAAFGDNEDIVELLLEKGVYLEEKDEKGMTALAWATLQRSGKAMDVLIDKGADINTQDKDGRTPLMMAILNYHIDEANFLIDNGADLNIKDNVGKTALMFAVSENCVNVGEKLIEKGADIGIKNNDGETARDMAKRLNMRTMEWNLQEAEKKLKNKNGEKNALGRLKVFLRR